MKIAVCITTRNRVDVFNKAMMMHRVFLPDNARLFIVDDNSDAPAILSAGFWSGESWYRSSENIGIPKAKNKCIELAMDWGADHIFLFDDDCWPIQDGWSDLYINNKEPHLMYQFKLDGKNKKNMQIVAQEKDIIAYSHTRGAMLYMTKKVINTVGGFDIGYGAGMYEHTDFTNRVYNNGLTTYRAMDVIDSSDYLYCLDQDGKVESSIPTKTRDNNLKKNHNKYLYSKTSKEYKGYR